MAKDVNIDNASEQNTLNGTIKDIGEEKEIIAEKSKSICPHCLKVIDCQITSRDNRVFMNKTCSEHGSFEVEIYSNAEDYVKAERMNKPGATPQPHQGVREKGCPEDCGLCEEHKQHTCVGIIEITDRCNMNCPVCFADTDGTYSLPLDKVKEMIDLYVKCEGEPEVLQISGGEPTIHPDIIQILEYAGQRGIKYPMLNTNGIKLADREFAKKVADTMKDLDMPYGTPIIYLQFDGLSDDIYKKLRGRPMLDIKMKAIENCAEFGMTVCLIPTIVRGVNDHEIGKIMELALDNDDIRMVNFQPSTHVGRYQVEDSEEAHITVPEVLDEIEKQTSGKLRKDHFINIPCPHPTCSACTYVYNLEGESIVLTDIFDVDDYMDQVVNRTLPDMDMLSELNKALDSLLSMSVVPGGESTENAICTTCGIAIPNIKNMIDNITIVSVHAFMDEYNFDLKRAQKCCITEILPDGNMIPFCVYNTLYRKKLTPNYKEYCE